MAGERPTADLRVSFDLPPALQARALRRLEGKLVDGTLVIAASEHRSQWQNRVAAQQRLAAKKQRSAPKSQRSGRLQLPED